MPTVKKCLPLTAPGDFGLEYLGSLVYKYVGGELQLESTGFGSGRIVVSEGSNGIVYTPNYYITDHLGSTRAIYDGSSNIVRSDFLPYGTRWNNGQAASSRYQFTGYEDQELLDRKYMDAGARLYNGRTFNTIDPLAGNYPWITPYAYCANNPINRIDPDGMDWYPSIANDRENNHHIEDFGQPSYHQQSKQSKPSDNSPPKPSDNPQGESDEKEESRASKTMKATMILSLGLLADDVTGVGVADDVLIPVVLIGGSVVAATYATIDYFSNKKKNKETSSDSKYSDRGGHSTNTSPSNKPKHEKGDERRGKDKGGEKGDSRRKRHK